MIGIGSKPCKRIKCGQINFSNIRVSWQGFCSIVLFVIMGKVEAGGYGFGGGYGVGYGSAASVSAGSNAFGYGDASLEGNIPGGSIISLSGLLELGANPFIPKTYGNNNPDKPGQKNLQINGVPDILGGFLGVLDGSNRRKCSQGNCQDMENIPTINPTDGHGNLGSGSVNVGLQPSYGIVNLKPDRLSPSVPTLSFPVLSFSGQCKGNNCDGPSKDLLTPPFGTLIPVCVTGNCNPPLTNGGGCFNGNCNENSRKRPKLPNQDSDNFISPQRPNSGDSLLPSGHGSICLGSNCADQIPSATIPQGSSSGNNNNKHSKQFPYGSQSENPANSQRSPTSDQNSQPRESQGNVFLKKDSPNPCFGLFCYTPDSTEDNDPSASVGRNPGNQYATPSAEIPLFQNSKCQNGDCSNNNKSNKRPQSIYDGPQRNRDTQQAQTEKNYSANQPSGPSYVQSTQPSLVSPCQSGNCYSGNSKEPSNQHSDGQHRNQGRQPSQGPHCERGDCNSGSPSNTANPFLNGPHGNQHQSPSQGAQCQGENCFKGSPSDNPQGFQCQNENCKAATSTKRPHKNPDFQLSPGSPCRNGRCDLGDPSKNPNIFINRPQENQGPRRVISDGRPASNNPHTQYVPPQKQSNYPSGGNSGSSSSQDPTQNASSNGQCNGDACLNGSSGDDGSQLESSSQQQESNGKYPCQGGTCSIIPAPDSKRGVQIKCQNGKCIFAPSSEGNLNPNSPCRGPSCQESNQSQGTANKNENPWHPVINPEGGSNDWHPGVNPQTSPDVKVVVVEYPSDGKNQPLPNKNLNQNLPISPNLQIGYIKDQTVGDIIFPNTCLTGDCGRKKPGVSITGNVNLNHPLQGGYGSSSSNSWSSSFANTGSWSSGNANGHVSDCSNGKCDHSSNKLGASSYAFASASASASAGSHSY